jgi:glycosyltransferase involved in cell wall biosynthesis
MTTAVAAAADRLRAAGISRIESYAWRDLDDPEAGGSELHADQIMRRWAAAGLEVTHRTSVPRSGGRPRRFERDGYRVEHRGGRYGVFPRVALSQLLRRRPADTATIEIWNGVPWFGPVWAPRRRVVWLHHVHREMWDDALPFPLDRVGRFVETRFAPLWYRGSAIATLSESSAAEIRALGLEHLTVIPPGVGDHFTPDPTRRAATPTVVIVGRMAPVKRHVAALDALRTARRRVPSLTVEVVGDGPSRVDVDAWVAAHDAAAWVRLLGRVDDDALVDAYRRAWLVVSASHAEGWGMSLTEGAACGTPCVATDIAGHRGAAVADETGLLVPDAASIADAVVDLVADPDRRHTLAAAARRHAAGFTWDSVAARHLDLLTTEVRRRGRRS